MRQIAFSCVCGTSFDFLAEDAPDVPNTVARISGRGCIVCAPGAVVNDRWFDEHGRELDDDGDVMTSVVN